MLKEGLDISPSAVISAIPLGICNKSFVVMKVK